MKLPSEYVTFLKLCNGGEGFIGDEEYVILWSIEELASMNDGYEIEKYVPGLLVFGSNAGGEAYGFDTRTPESQIVSVPFVGMEWSLALPKGASFEAFLGCLYETKDMREVTPTPRFTASDLLGKEIFEVHPVILSGSPTDPANKVLLSRAEHMQAVVWWNGVVADMRRLKREAMKREPPGE
jgi:hypothetical protein